MFLDQLKMMHQCQFFKSFYLGPWDEPTPKLSQDMDSFSRIEKVVWLIGNSSLFLLRSYFSIPCSFDFTVSKPVGIGGHKHPFFKL